jgi:hypothetical protein
MQESAALPPDEVAAWVCLKREEDLAAALRRNATLHHTRREARDERRAWPTSEPLRVVPLMVRRRSEPSRKRRYRRVARGTWTWIRCSGCGYEGEMVDVRRCAKCDDVLCSQKCCDEHECRRRLPHEDKRMTSTSLLTSSSSLVPERASPTVAAPEPGFTRHARGSWQRIRCVACGYLGEMIDVFRCNLCNGMLCGRACCEAHDCRVQQTGT